MNKDQVAGGFKELKGKLKAKWGDLTDDELTEAEGREEELVGKIQKKYGGTKEAIAEQIRNL